MAFISEERIDVSEPVVTDVAVHDLHNRSNVKHWKHLYQCFAQHQYTNATHGIA